MVLGQTSALRVLARTLCFSAAGLVVLGSYAGCSSGSKASPDLGPIPPAEPVALEAFCPEYAAALCLGIQNCCPLKERKVGTPGQCVQRERTRCETELLPIIGSSQTFNPQRAGDLVARLRESGADCSEPRGPVYVRYVNRPALVAEPCYSCEDERASCVSRCLEGEPCDFVTPCAPGLECVDGACQTHARVGAPCSGGCAEGKCVYTPPAIAYRDASLSDLENTCQYAYPDGATSLRAEDCASGLQRRDPPRIGNVRCFACHSHRDCTNLEGGFVSVNPLFGFCFDGKCGGSFDAIDRNRPAGAPCGSHKECRSLNCVPPSGDEIVLRCGRPDRVKIFCEVPVIDP